MEKLAILGGKPLRTKPYPPNITTGKEEIKAVVEVMERGIFSDFEALNNEFFLGGDQVKSFEKEWSDYFGVKYAVGVNSATSGLYTAVGAAGIGPGDEVIVTPWTMAATATAIIANNAIPVFCDITKDTFTMDPKSLREKITPRTKAIMPVHIYGHPADMQEIMKIAKEDNLTVIEDAAQSPGAYYKGKLTGTIGDMGVFSLNCHKIIQCGEGGVVVTDDEKLALRLRLIRNHAEAVIATGMNVNSLANMVGYNYRLNEIEAAISRVQLQKLESLLEQRRELVDYITDKLQNIEGLLTPTIKEGCTHTFYRYALRLDSNKIKVPTPKIVEALNAEGMEFYAGYMPLNLYPIYQKRIGYGKQGCPFTCPYYKGKVDYTTDSLPNVRQMMNYSFSTEVIRPPLTFRDMDEICYAFEKVFGQLGKLESGSII